MNLQEQIGAAWGLYGQRNAMYLRGEQPALFLRNRISKFCKSIRKKERDKKVLAGQLSAIFAWTVGLAGGFGNLPLVEALCEKYSARGCSYCGRFPCACSFNRTSGDPALGPILSDQLLWTISQWVRHNTTLYGENNRREGIYSCLLRLREEIDEVEEAYLLERIADPSMLLEERRQKLAREFADVFAWIFSIAGMFDLGDLLEEAITVRYAGNCGRCDKRPCQCGPPTLYRGRARPLEYRSEPVASEPTP